MVIFRLKGVMDKSCRVCNISKTVELFVKNRNICIDCNNKNRRDKYKNDEELRKRLFNNQKSIRARKLFNDKKNGSKNNWNLVKIIKDAIFAKLYSQKMNFVRIEENAKNVKKVMEEIIEKVITEKINLKCGMMKIAKD